MAGDIKISNDALGLSKPLTRLVEIVGVGIGTTYEDIFKTKDKRIERITDAEIKAEQKRILESEKTKTAILLEQAQRRFLLEQYKKQVNLNNIVAEASTLLDGKSVSTANVDEDWATRFVNVAEDASDEHIQKLLADILANEAQTPGLSSKRLLDFLRSTDRKELTLFSKFAGVSSNIGMYHLGSFDSPGLRQYDLSVPEIRKLADIGLTNFSKDLSIHLDMKEGRPEVISFYDRAVQIVSKKDRHIELGIVALTDLGEQLYSVAHQYASNQYSDKYFGDLTTFLERNELIVSMNMAAPD